MSWGGLVVERRVAGGGGSSGPEDRAGVARWDRPVPGRLASGLGGSGRDLGGWWGGALARWCQWSASSWVIFPLLFPSLFLPPLLIPGP